MIKLNKIKEVTVTEFRVDFHNVLSQVEREGMVFLTRYHNPTHVLMSYDEFQKFIEVMNTQKEVEHAS